MKLNQLSEDILKIIAEKNLYLPLIENLEEGLILVRNKDFTLLYINRKAMGMLSVNNQDNPKSLNDILDSKDCEAVIRRENRVSYSYRGAIQISVHLVEDYTVVLLNDVSKEVNDAKHVDEIRQLNKELQLIYEQYADDTIFISDGNGYVEFSGAAIAANCGVSPGYMIGKNVYELENERIFYPSVTGRVLESRQTEVIIQNTNIGKVMVAVGTPIFDREGNITKVISITRDYSRQIKIGTLLSKLDDSKSKPQSGDSEHKDIITCNDKMLNILALAKLVSRVNSTVLISGETGTGKEVFARYIHNTGKRAGKSFIKVNCGAISPSLVESELFGYEPGSFTGAKKEGKIGLVEASNGGTLFLDEISELPLGQQVKLLQVIQERSMTRVGGTDSICLDIRIIAASNKDLEKLVDGGEFREDLYYRLNVVPISLPPLRERHEDIPLLIRHFLNYFNIENDSNKEFTKEAFRLMCSYTWPGNVRELVNTIERLTITSRDALIDVDDLPEKIRRKDEKDGEAVVVNRIVPLTQAIEDLERRLIKMAIDQYGSGKRAAELLGVNQSTISRKMSQYGLSPKK